MNDDEPDFLTSLNDTLTCGFGASLLLFFVFAVLVIFEDVPSGRATASDTVEMRRGYATDPDAEAQRASLFVRVASRDHAFISALRPPNDQDWIIRQVQPEGSGYTVKTFHAIGGQGQHTFLLDSGVAGIGTEYYLSVLVGGTPLTELPAVRRFHVADSFVFRIGLANLRPITFPERP